MTDQRRLQPNTIIYYCQPTTRSWHWETESFNSSNFLIKRNTEAYIFGFLPSDKKVNERRHIAWKVLNFFLIKWGSKKIATKHNYLLLPTNHAIWGLGNRKYTTTSVLESKSREVKNEVTDNVLPRYLDTMATNRICGYIDMYKCIA